MKLDMFKFKSRVTFLDKNSSHITSVRHSLSNQINKVPFFFTMNGIFLRIKRGGLTCLVSSQLGFFCEYRKLLLIDLNEIRYGILYYSLEEIWRKPEITEKNLAPSICFYVFPTIVWNRLGIFFKSFKT